MARNLSIPMIASIESDLLVPAFLFLANFRSATVYVWSGVGDLVYGGNTYKGVGSFGKVAGISEGVEVNADGTSVTLSGIDATLLSETMSDVQLGAPAKIFFAALNPVSCSVVATYLLYSGTIDQPSVQPGIETFDITIKLENRMSDLQRANMRRYTSADQRLYYPDDTAFTAVESLNDQALRWGG